MTESIENRLILLGHQVIEGEPVLVRKNGLIACECDFEENGYEPRLFEVNHENDCVLSIPFQVIKIINQ